MSDKNPAGDINITSNYQSGGITAHTVNVSPRFQRALGDSIRQKLLQNISRQKLAVVWASHGDEESYKYAAEIFDFLKLEGFNLFGSAPVNNIFIEPVYGVIVTPRDEKTEIYVGILSDSEKTITHL
jgi:hypothetical protein